MLKNIFRFRRDWN